MNALEKLRQVTDQLGSKPTPDNWALAGRLLARFPVDPKLAQAAIQSQDHPALDALVRSLENPAPKAPPPTFTEGDLTAALKAFRKRLKLMRLEDESKLGGRYTSAGKPSGIDAIVPPDGFNPAIWRALVAAGKLRDTGGGLYAEP